MFRLNKFFVILVCIFCSLINVNAQTGPVVIKSPDGQIEIEIATLHDIALSAEGGQLAYQVSFQGKQVLEWSHLGLIIESSPVLGSNVRIQSSEMSVMDETWTSVQGKANPIRNHYNAVTVQTLETDSNGRRLIIEARAYDDGVAFRYFIPEQPFVKELKILNEITQFRFSKDANTFPMISRGFQTSNEDDYHELTINGMHPEYLVNLPLLINLPGIAWVGLTEADLEVIPFKVQSIFG
ncbi:MAG: glycoside hydrolase family 97 N-terminal domain-containing protein [Ignavibacteriaceae bacterium]